MLFAPAQSQTANETGTEYYDSVEISLITCSPHEEIYSLYGHSALRVRDLHTGEDLSFNYGVFNYKQDFFVLRFVFGKTDYELGIAPFGEFCKYYKYWGSQVSEQVLNLTAPEKRNIVRELFINYRPENRVYRYNFFFDNCASRPRDVIERNVGGRIQYQAIGQEPSFRQMIHEHNKLHPWNALGIDLLLGVRADMPTTQREQHFLPENLERDFAQATILNADGTTRKLVKERRIVIEPGIQLVKEEFPISPLVCAIILLVVSLIIFVWEWRHRHTTVWWDTLLMLTIGLAGCIVLLMFFSEHPATSSNLMVLLLNPLHLFFIPSVIRRRKTYYWRGLPYVVLLFFIGGLWQDYPGEMYFVALFLLIRYCSHLRNDK